MANKRMDRVAEAYQHALSEILCYKIRDPRLVAVSVTNVVFTPDLSLAKIYFVFFGYTYFGSSDFLVAARSEFYQEK